MTSRPSPRSTLRATLLAVPLTLILAACAGSAAAPSPSATAGPPATARPTPTPVIGDPGNGGGGGTDPGTGSGGGSGGNTGGGIVFPDPGDPNANPLFGPATYVTPAKDLLNPHPVNVQLVRAIQNEDGTVTADLRWYSGVAPCNQLDHVEVIKDDAAKTIRFTVVEGSGKGDVMCIEIAQLNATIVELGTIPPGDWQLSAEGDAPTINLTVK